MSRVLDIFRSPISHWQFAEKAAKKSQMGLDYGTSLNSLSQSLDQGGTNAKIKKLEQSARSIKKVSTRIFSVMLRNIWT